MVIQIAIQETQPLTGTASIGTQEPVPFLGWLDLLRAVSELVTASGQPPDCRPASVGDLLELTREEDYLS